MKSKPGYEKTLEVIKSTSSMPVEQAIETLMKCTKKGISLASIRAVHAIAGINHPSVVPSLINIYGWVEEDPHKRDRGCDVRLAIVEVLGDINSPFAINILRKAIRTVQIVRLGPAPEDVAISLRAAAAIALAKVDSDSLYELSLLLFDEEPAVPVNPINRPFVKAPVRKAAARAIGILGDSGGMTILAIKLKFPNEEIPDVLAECLESLIFMQPPYLMEIVEPYLKGSDEYLSAITALSLAENLGMEVLDLLREILEDMSGEAKEAIVIAISVIRGGGIRQILLDFLDHPNPFVRRGAVKGIKSYVDDEVMKKLQVLHETDSDKIVRLEAGKV